MEHKSTANYIKAIAEVRSISVAAENLGISQPALSSYLKKQEKELGAALFDRSKQPLEITEAGKAYIDFLDRAAVLQRELTQNLADIADMNTGDLTVGGASFFNVAYIPGAIAEFAKKYPNINIEIIDGKVSELTTAAHNGVLDLFITPFDDETDRFSYEELLSEKIYLAVPSEWEINRELKNSTAGGKITKEQFRELCRYTFITLKKEQHIGQIMEKLFRKYGCRPERIITAEQTMTTFALTLSGVGISLITESSINHSGRMKLPELYTVDPSICSREIYIAYPKNKYMSRATKEFIRILKRVNKNS